MLGPVMSWFSEGFGIPDVEEVRISAIVDAEIRLIVDGVSA
jgi:fumarylacetoacetate (FAA) hydrolase family protein